MALSPRTIAEMEAGARQVAARYANLTPEHLADLTDRVQEIAARANAMALWVRSGLVKIEEHSEAADGGKSLRHRKLHHVKNGPTFEESPVALQFGGYPSELLVAQIALAIQAVGER